SELNASNQIVLKVIMKILIMMSGGLNSIFCTALACKEVTNRKDITLVHFDISHISGARELKASQKIASYFEVSLIELKIQLPNWNPFQLSTLIFYTLAEAYSLNQDFVYCGISS